MSGGDDCCNGFIVYVRVTAWDILLGGHQRIRGKRGGRRNGIWRLIVGGENCVREG